MNDNIEPKHTGGCQCGAVRYALKADPTSAGICHCRMCQKALGAPFGTFSGVSRADLEWTRGTPSTYRSSSLAERGYCEKCGTPLTYDFLDGNRITISVYTLDRPGEIDPPTRQIGTESRASWLDDLNTFPGKTTEADSGADFVAACVNYQHPDHETPVDWTPPEK